MGQETSRVYVDLIKDVASERPTVHPEKEIKVSCPFDVERELQGLLLTSDLQVGWYGKIDPGTGEFNAVGDIFKIEYFEDYVDRTQVNDGDEHGFHVSKKSKALPWTENSRSKTRSQRTHSPDLDLLYVQ